MTSPGLAMTPRGEVARLGEKTSFSEILCKTRLFANSLALDLARAR
jgi:hypothetical protein